MKKRKSKEQQKIANRRAEETIKRERYEKTKKKDQRKQE